jgi:hypothetical protein
MNKTNTTDEIAKKPFLIKAIDYVVDSFLYISFLFLFMTIFRKIFGESLIGGIAGFALSIPIATIVFNLINKSFAGFIIFFLFSLPAFALALVFLFM